MSVKTCPGRGSVVDPTPQNDDVSKSALDNAVTKDEASPELRHLYGSRDVLSAYDAEGLSVR
jgi:hypothetical protein